MKKMLSMLLALTIAAAGSFSALTVACAASSENGPHTEVTATIANPDPAIRVDITWTNMDFTYTDSDWNPATHSYDAGSWTTTGGEITVTNTGAAAVNASFAFAPAGGVTGVTGTFTKDTLGLNVGESGSTQLSLSGRPNTALQENTPTGTVTVTVKQPTQNP